MYDNSGFLIANIYLWKKNIKYKKNAMNIKKIVHLENNTNYTHKRFSSCRYMFFSFELDMVVLASAIHHELYAAWL
jgi:hypothetical protein